MTGDDGKSIRMSDYDYDLPEELIAQIPLADRAASRLMVVERSTASIQHRTFGDLPALLAPGDLVVVNDSRVIPARLTGTRATGGEVEFLLLRELSPRVWQVLMRPARRLRIGESVVLRSSTGDAGGVTVLEKHDDGQGVVELEENIAARLDDFGSMPLPPYIHSRLDDRERYQTVYSQAAGSAAAPTAGLHFTTEVMDRLEQRGIGVASVTLHVGLDTFRPVTAEYADEHRIHSEWFEIMPRTISAIAETRQSGGKVVAIGTTAARTLESWGKRETGDQGGPVSGMTDIYITPGHQWRAVDAMVTNFHLPRSTLLLMLSAFAGKDLLRRAYDQAIAERYRFFSFGDAMLVL